MITTDKQGEQPDSLVRPDATADILRALVTITRRGVTDARAFAANAVGPQLTEAEQSIVAFIADNPHCRSTDVATAYRLNRSTVSRQLERLQSIGLVQVMPDVTGRGRPLELTGDGRAHYQHTMAYMRTVLADRIAEWSDEEVAGFATSLKRFVDADLTAPQRAGDAGERSPGHQPLRRKGTS
jgi:DNA-binding MarR family transcriptional regulator